MSLDWYPLIDYDKCINCLICYDFCPRDVYDLDGDKPIVIKPEDCVSRCHGCEKQCPQEAISYFNDPSKRKAPKADRAVLINLG